MTQPADQRKFSGEIATIGEKWRDVDLVGFKSFSHQSGKMPQNRHRSLTQ
jgi:hypothetical protein